jgi:hypothetical protein
VPCEAEVGRGAETPPAHPIHRAVWPLGDPAHQPPGMVGGMQAMMIDQPDELAAPG